MSSALDMSLDDIIKNNKKSGPGVGNSRRRGRGGSGLGPSRQFFKRSAYRSNPSFTEKVPAPDSTWKHYMFSQSQGGLPVKLETGTKLHISNLDYGVSNEDIKELFSEVGDIKRYFIHYDRTGRSKGTAEVVFSRRLDAVVALKRYNNVQLDGKPMKIEMVIPVAMKLKATAKGKERRGGAFTRGIRGGNGGGRGRGRGSGSEKITAEDLDADLVKYHAEEMLTR